MITTPSRKLRKFALFTLVGFILSVIGVTLYTTIPRSDVEASLVVVSNFTVESDSEYLVVKDGLNVGAVVYTDRCFDTNNCFKYNDTLPTYLRGVTYIQTANDDKSASEDVFISFDVNRDVTVYVAFDNRTDDYPNWIFDGWVETGDLLTVHDAMYTIFSKAYTAGSTVELGGNRAEGAEFPTGFISMYTVAIVEPPVLFLGENSVNAGEETSIPVILDRVPKGITGFSIVAAISDAAIGEFTGAEFPEFGEPALSSVTVNPLGYPEGSIRLATTQLSNDPGQSGDVNVHLADLIVRGKLEGMSSIEIIDVQELTSREIPFEPIDAQLAPGKLTVLNVPVQVDVAGNVTVDEGMDISKQITIDDPGDESWTVTVDFGDGTAPETFPVTDPNVVLSHVYADNRGYFVNVTVEDEASSDSGSFGVTVNNLAPAVSAGENRGSTEGASVNFADAMFNDSGTADVHAAIVDWGDGSSNDVPVIETPFGPPGSASGMDGTVGLGSHTYADDGTYTVTVTVTDDEGDSSSDDFTVTVGNADPQLGELPDKSARVGDIVTMGPVPFTDAGLVDTHTATIDWGDGTAPTAALIDPVGRNMIGTHSYSAIDTFTVTVDLEDGDGGEVSRSFDVEIRGLDARIEFALEGTQRPALSVAWEKPTTVTLSRNGEADIVVSENSVYDAANRLAFIQINGLESGIYDITVVSESTIAVIKRSVQLTSSKSVNMGPLPAGNANGDAIIDVSDFGLLAAAFNTQFGDGAYNANADFDSNGFVNSFDYDLLVSNFGKFSPYEAGQ